jgi:hypothetical protein
MKIKKFTILVVALLLLILMPPLLESTIHLESESHFFFSALALVAAVYAGHGKGWRLWVSLVLFGITMGVHLTALQISNFPLDIVNMSMKVVFFTFVLINLFRAIASDKYEISDRIMGSVAVYLLLGLAWSRIYTLYALFEPQSLLDSHGNSIQKIIDTTYFSFSTLTTVGYGDITPQTSFVRALSAMEATVGMLFLAVWIAFLISSGISTSEKSGKEKR